MNLLSQILYCSVYLLCTHLAYIYGYIILITENSSDKLLKKTNEIIK